MCEIITMGCCYQAPGSCPLLGYSAFKNDGCHKSLLGSQPLEAVVLSPLDLKTAGSHWERQWAVRSPYVLCEGPDCLNGVTHSASSVQLRGWRRL